MEQLTIEMKILLLLWGKQIFCCLEHYDTVANPGSDTMDIYARTVQRSGSNLVLGSLLVFVLQQLAKLIQMLNLIL